MLSSSILASVLLLVAGAQAHMSIVFPPPFDAKTNVNINAPISAAQFPCNGLLKTGGPSAATLIAGAESKITFKGSASDSGGSCQVALTYDKTNFYVIHSWQGGCPTTDGGSLPFTVPSDAPLGEAVFAWTWINKVGNREFYMNCGAVTIAAGTGPAPTIPFLSRPDLFVANLNNGCSTPDSTDTTYPDPGPDVTGAGPGKPLTGCQPVNGVGNSVRGSGGAAPPAAAPPSPNLSASSPPIVSQPASSIASKPATSVVLQPSSSAPAVQQPPVASTPVISQPASSSAGAQPGRNITTTFSTFTGTPIISVPTTLPSGISSEPSTFSQTGGLITITEFTTLSSTPTSVVGTPSAAPTPPANGTAPASPSPSDTVTPGGGEGLEESTDGTCGGTKKCRAGFCCSAAGFCGDSSLHCGGGCQTAFGQCGSASRRSNPLAYYHGHRRRFHAGVAGVAGRVRV